MGDWTVVGVLTERNGKIVGVEHQGTDVRIVVRAPIKGGPVLTQLVMGGEERDAFLKLFAAAEHEAERDDDDG